MARKAETGKNRTRRIYIVLLPLLVLLAAGNLFYGAVPIPRGRFWTSCPEAEVTILPGASSSPAPVCPRRPRPCWPERHWQ